MVSIAIVFMAIDAPMGARAEQLAPWMGPVPMAAPEIVVRFAAWHTMLGTQFPTVLANVEMPCIPPEIKPSGESKWRNHGGSMPFELWSPSDGNQSFLLTRFTISPTAEIHIVGADGRPQTIRFNVVETVDTPGMFLVTLCSYRLVDDAATLGGRPEGFPKNLDYSFDRVVLVSHRPIRKGFLARPVQSAMTFRADGQYGGPPVPTDLLDTLRSNPITEFLARDRIAPEKLSYERDLLTVDVQHLLLTMAAGRRREHYMSAYWHFEALSTSHAVRVWTILKRSGRRLMPVHLSKLEGDWVPMVDFLPSLVADLDGDGIDELIGQRAMHEGAGTGIVTWINGAPVYVSHGY